MRTAISYIRYSTPSQQWGDSERRQLEATKEFCRLHGYKLSDIRYSDLGKSAFHSKQDSLKMLLDAIHTNKIKPNDHILIVESLDRISREDILTASLQLQNLLQTGLAIATLIDGIIYEKSMPDLALKLGMSMMLISRAHEESLTKSKRVQASKKNTRDQIANGEVIFMGGKTPHWIEWNGEQFIFNQHKTAVEFMIEKRLLGWGYKRIRDALPGEWYTSTIKSILTNPALYGAFRRKSNGEIVSESYYPAITTKETYTRIQNKRGRPGINKPKWINIFAGLLKCDCGRHIALQNKGCHKGVRYIYMKCEHCGTHPFTSEKEQQILDQLNRIDWDRMAGEDAIRVELLLAQKAEKEQQIKNAMGSLEKILFAGGDPTVANTIISKAKEDLHAIEATIQAMQGQHTNIDLLTADRAEIARFCREMLDRIVMKGGEVSRVVYKTGQDVHYIPDFDKLKKHGTASILNDVIEGLQGDRDDE